MSVFRNPILWLERRLVNLPIAWKLSAVIVIFSLSVAGSLFLSYVAMDTLSSVRAYIAGEGHWSKAQKQAMYRLGRYAHRRDPVDYQRFLNYLAIPEGDRRARETMDRPDGDMQVATEGFIAGANHPEDVPGMIRLYKRFRDVSFMADAVRCWREGDGQIARLRATGEALHAQVVSGRATPEEVDRLLMRAEEINNAVTPFEDAFSKTLGDSARFLKRAVLSALIIGGFLFGGFALLVSVLISRRLTRDIEMLRDAAARIARGDFASMKFPETEDEIGELAEAFDRMRQQRQSAEEKILTLNRDLETANAELRSSNMELESFSHSISHDLRAPLRSIDGFTAALQEDHASQLTPGGLELLRAVRRNTSHMAQMIEGLLAFSRLSYRKIQPKPLDLKALVKDVVDQLRAEDRSRKIDVQIGELGTLPADPVLMRQVFVNLLSNAFKFTRGRSEAKVEIGVRSGGTADIYFVKDNGVGFDMAYADKLFGVFQRLHKESEFEGTGVGLSLVRRILFWHGGRIWAEAAPGEGACFMFWFLNAEADRDGLQKR